MESAVAAARPGAIRICFICNEYPPLPHAGIGTQIRDLAERLAALGVGVWVMGYGRRVSGPFEQNGVRVHWLTLPSILSRRVHFRGFTYSFASVIQRQYLSLRLSSLIRRQGVNIVESHDFNGPLAWKPPAALIVRLHGSVAAMRHGEERPLDMNPLDRYYERKQLGLAGRIIAVSKYVGPATEQAFGTPLQHEVIYNGVDTKRFSPRDGEVDPDVVLFAGTIMWRKGVFDLIRAMPRLLERRPSARLVIAGGAAGEHLRLLEKELAQLSPEARKRVTMAGRIDHADLPSVYNRAAVFVFPSRVEPFGLTCAEAMACGRPVVATRLASGPELVEDGVSGLLADPASPDELAAKIGYLLNNPARAEELGRAARARVLERFDLAKLVHRNLACYEDVIRSATRAASGSAW